MPKLGRSKLLLRHSYAVRIRTTVTPPASPLRNGQIRIGGHPTTTQGWAKVFNTGGVGGQNGHPIPESAMVQTKLIEGYDLPVISFASLIF